MAGNKILQVKENKFNNQRKKILQKIAVVLFLTLISFNAISQVSGISGSKLGAYCVDVVNHHKVEFEPAFFHFQSKSYWDNNSNIQYFDKSHDSIKLVTGINFRITYGLLNKLEIGASMSSDLQLGSLGVRYVFFDKEKHGLAIIAGANIPMGNKTVDKSLRLSNTIPSVGGGVVYSTYFNENLSLDFNGQYFRFIEKTHDQNKGSVFINSEVGYYVFSRKLQLITGFGYQLSHYDDFNSQVLTVFPGITVETGKNYIIVLSAPFDIWGVNAGKNFGVLLALTVTLN